MLHRAKMETKESSHDAKEKDSAMPVKLDASALDHIEKHRYVICLFIQMIIVCKEGFIFLLLVRHFCYLCDKFHHSACKLIRPLNLVLLIYFVCLFTLIVSFDLIRDHSFKTCWTDMVHLLSIHNYRMVSWPPSGIKHNMVLTRLFCNALKSG